MRLKMIKKYDDKKYDEDEKRDDDKEYVQKNDDEQSYLCEKVIQGAKLKPVQ